MAIRIPYTKYNVVRPHPTAEMYQHFRQIDRNILKRELRNQRQAEIQKRSALTPGYNGIIKWLLISMGSTLSLAAIAYFLFHSEAAAFIFLAIFALAFIIGSLTATSPSATQSSYVEAAREKERLFLNIEIIAKKASSESHFYALYETQDIPLKAYPKIGLGIFIFLFGLITQYQFIICAIGISFIAFGSYMLYERHIKISESRK